MKILIGSSNAVPLIEKFNASMSLVSCILSDEPVFPALEVSVTHKQMVTCRDYN